MIVNNMLVRAPKVTAVHSLLSPDDMQTPLVMCPGSVLDVDYHDGTISKG